MMKKIICVLLTLAMIFSSLPMTAVASSEDGSSEKAETVAVEETAETEVPSETKASADAVGETAEPIETSASAKENGATAEPVEKQVKEPADGKAEKPTDETAEESIDGKVEKPADEKAEKPADEKAEKTADETEKAVTQETPAAEEASHPAFSQKQKVNGVVITVTADEGVFPKGAELVAKAVPTKAQKKIDNALEEEREEGEVAVSYTFDIKVVDANGKEIQPPEGKTVKVLFSLAEVANENLTAHVYHTSEDKAGELNAEALSVDTKGKEAVVETEGFSFYTVEFTYEEKQYVLSGGKQVKLSEILNQVGLSGEVEGVKVSDKKLFTAEKTDGEWVITSKKAFSTEEWMKVTLDGIEYTIIVTDANKEKIYVSAAGSDDTGDGSEASPYATLDKANDESVNGTTIYLLGDIEMSKYVYIKHNLTIDGQGHTITRADGFASTSDTGRSWYNPGMFELHPDKQDVTVTFQNVTIDEEFKHEGETYKFQATGSGTNDNLKRVQDGIISLYYAGGSHKAVAVLEKGTSLKNFGGMTAVRVQADNELIMKAGSLIDNGGEKKTSAPDNSNEAGAVTTQNGSLTMEKGSKITGIKNINCITSNSGTINVDGEISNCNSGAMIRPMGLTHLTLGRNSEIHDVTNAYCVIYGNSCVEGTVFDIDGKIHDVTCSVKRGGIWPSNSGANITINITENAEFYNIPGQVIRSDGGATINMSGGKIYDSGAALFIRKAAICNITGGEIKGNTFGVLLAEDGSSTNRINVNSAAEVVERNTYDYFIDRSNSDRGYEEGSWMYFSEEKLAENPMVVMGDMNADNYAAAVTVDKEITLPASNGYMYLGNASKASKSTLDTEAERLSLANKLTYWWFRNDKGEATFDVAKIVNLNEEPLYALYVPVDESGNATGDVKCVPVTRDGDKVSVSLSTSDYKSAKGYSVLIAQASPPTFTVTINYLDKDTNEEIADAYTADFVKDSNYDVTAQANKEIDDYKIDSIVEESALTGKMTEDLTIKVYYKSKLGTIKFDTDGGSEIDPITREIGSDVIAPDDPTKKGYTFAGWEPEVPAQMPEGETTVKAKWTVNQYKVTYKYLGTVPGGASKLPAEKSYDYNSTVEIAAPATAAGYTFSGWSKTENFNMPAEDVEITGTFTVNGNTPYKVEHYKAKTDGTYELADTEELKGKTDSEVTANPKKYEGFTLNEKAKDAVPSGKIIGDGSLVLKLYYDRNKETTPSEPKNDASYKVEHYKENLDGKYELADTEDLKGKIDSVATASPKTYEGFTLNEKAKAAIPSGKITGDDNLVLKLYYDRNVYVITFDPNGGEYEESTKPTAEEHKHGETIKMKAATREGYTFQYWKGSEYHEGDEYVVTEDHKFEAQWKKNKKSAKKPESKKSSDDDKKSSKSAPSKNAPAKTGDNSSILLYGVLALLAAAALSIILAIRRRCS